MSQRVAGQRPAQPGPFAAGQPNAAQMPAGAAVVEVQLRGAVVPDHDVVLGGIAARPALEAHEHAGRLARLLVLMRPAAARRDEQPAQRRAGGGQGGEAPISSSAWR